VGGEVLEIVTAKYCNDDDGEWEAEELEEDECLLRIL
jgi:hypothetical protein